VLEAIRGLRTIYSGKGAKLVPLKERAAAVSVNRQAKAAIERDSWVRVRGGLYKDDLAKVGWGIVFGEGGGYMATVHPRAVADAGV
jgi:hypothetical protein